MVFFLQIHLILETHFLPVVGPAVGVCSCGFDSVLSETVSDLFSFVFDSELSSRFNVLSKSFNALLNCSNLSIPLFSPSLDRVANVFRLFLRRAS